MQHAAGRRRLAAVDHAPAGLNRQIAFEGEAGLFEECLIVFAAEAEIFDLEHDDGNVVVIEIETANILVRYARHIESPLPGLRDAGNQRVSAIARSIARVVALTPTE